MYSFYIENEHLKNISMIKVILCLMFEDKKRIQKRNATKTIEYGYNVKKEN